MNSFVSLIATALALALSAHSQFYYLDKPGPGGKQISYNQFMSARGTGNRLSGSGAGSGAGSSRDRSSANTGNDDRNNYYDSSNKRISMQEYSSKYGDKLIKAAGNRDRVNIHPTYID
jgi:hypothetical protein